MNRRLAITLATLAYLSHGSCQSAWSQWYANSQSAGGGAASAGNVASNGMLNGSAGALSGNGYNVSNGLLPGGTLLPGNTGTGGTDASTDSGGGSAAGGSQYVSDPASAYESAATNGIATMIRAQGQYNEQTSKALGNYETARSQYIDNQQRLYSARRNIHRSMLAARAEDIEYKHANDARAGAFAASHRPQPLGSKHLDHSSGQIHWPTALNSPDFEDLRKSLDTEFSKYSKSGSDPEQTAEIKRQVHEMKDRLHEHVLKMPLESYSQARQFLDQLSVSSE